MTAGTDLFARVFAGAPEAMLLVDDEGTIVACNVATQRIFGYEPAALIGASVESLVPADLRKRHRRQRAGHSRAGAPRGMDDRTDLSALRADGTEIAVDIGLGVVEGPEGYLCVAVRDATRRRRQADHLAQLAYEDALTDVLNRRGFHERLVERLSLAQRSGGSIALLLIDIDHFKAVNDTYGHRVGDAVLTRAAAVLKRRLRTSDVVGRPGGDEFAAVLSDVTLQDAADVGEQVRATIERELAEHGVTASIGVAAARGDATTLDALVGAADEALYEAKEAGRNAVRSIAFTQAV